MSTWAIVPVSPIHKSRSRLSGMLTKEERFDLMREMFVHIMNTLRQVHSLDTVLVVSKEMVILDEARSFGARSYTRDAVTNLSNAANKSADYAWKHGARTIAILPSNLARLEAEAVDRLLTTSSRIAICPDENFDGTNALMLRDVQDFRFQYGEESFQKHLGEAARLRLVAQVVYSPSLEFDVDTPADLQRYRKTRVPQFA